MYDYRWSPQNNHRNTAKHLSTSKGAKESRHQRINDTDGFEGREEQDSVRPPQLSEQAKKRMGITLLIAMIIIAVVLLIVFLLLPTGGATGPSNSTRKTSVVVEKNKELEAAGANNTQPVESEDMPSISYAALVGDSWQDAVMQGDASGGSGGQESPIQAVRMELLSSAEGSIKYCVADESGAWGDMVQDGAQAGENGVSALRVVLSGDLENDYNVWYCTYVLGSGWKDWTSNGNPAGAAGSNARIGAYRVMVLPKPDECPGPTENPFQELTPSISGDAELDAMLEAIVTENISGTGDEALRNAFEYMATYLYVKQNELPEGDWSEWSVPYAKEMYQNGQGNCYRYASLFCWIARYLGYDAKVISGRVPMPEGLVPHGWVEIRKDGIAYVCDADMHKFKPNLNLFMITYDESPYEFHRVDGSLYTNDNALEY